MINLLFVFLILLNAQFAFGEASRSFDGANDNISMGTVLDVTTGNVSICVYAKMTEDASVDSLIGRKSGNTNNNVGYIIYQDATTDQPTVKFADGIDAVNSTAPVDIDGGWHFICGSFKASTEVSVIYLDGVQQDTDTGAGAIGSLTASRNFRFGDDDSTVGDANGLLVYGFMFHSEITIVEVNELLWKPESIVLNNPAGFWPLWGDSPEIDLKGGGLTGTVTGATTSTDGPPVMIGDAAI